MRKTCDGRVWTGPDVDNEIGIDAEYWSVIYLTEQDLRDMLKAIEEKKL